MKKLVLIDGNAVFHRAYHALPPFKTKKGELVNAVYGFASLLLKVTKEQQPNYLACAFDLAGPTFREKEYRDYKANRVKGPQDLYDQIPRIKELVSVFNIPIYEKNSFEADDIIGTIVQQTQKKDILNLIVTGDLDALQLVSNSVLVYFLKKGINQEVIYTQEKVFEKYQLQPSQLIDFKGLRGDPSDNIPGVTGIGPKTAIELLKNFKSLEAIYNQIESINLNPKLRARLLEYRQQALLSQKLATIKTDVPFQFDLAKSYWPNFEKDKVISFFEEMEFKTLINRLA